MASNAGSTRLVVVVVVVVGGVGLVAFGRSGFESASVSLLPVWTTDLGVAPLRTATDQVARTASPSLKRGTVL
jgi:hypothetical protein